MGELRHYPSPDQIEDTSGLARVERDELSRLVFNEMIASSADKKDLPWWVSQIHYAGYYTGRAHCEYVANSDEHPSESISKFMTLCDDLLATDKYHINYPEEGILMVAACLRQLDEKQLLRELLKTCVAPICGKIRFMPPMDLDDSAQRVPDAPLQAETLFSMAELTQAEGETHLLPLEPDEKYVALLPGWTSMIQQVGASDLKWKVWDACHSIFNALAPLSEADFEVDTTLTRAFKSYPELIKHLRIAVEAITAFSSMKLQFLSRSMVTFVWRAAQEVERLLPELEVLPRSQLKLVHSSFLEGKGQLKHVPFYSAFLNAKSKLPADSPRFSAAQRARDAAEAKRLFVHLELKHVARTAMVKKKLLPLEVDWANMRERLLAFTSSPWLGAFTSPEFHSGIYMEVNNSMRAIKRTGDASAFPRAVANSIRFMEPLTLEAHIRIGNITAPEQIAPLVGKSMASNRATDAVGGLPPHMKTLYQRIAAAYYRLRFPSGTPRPPVQTLPWLKLLETAAKLHRGPTEGQTRIVADFAFMARAYLEHFPAVLMPNPLTNALKLSYRPSVDSDLPPLVSELMVDMFEFKGFSDAFWAAARVAKQHLKGTAYDRYYSLNEVESSLKAMIAEGKPDTILAKVLHPLAGQQIEAMQILTTHNLLALLLASGLKDAALLESAAEKCITELHDAVNKVCYSSSLHILYPARKSMAISIRQLLFYVSVLEKTLPMDEHHPHVRLADMVTALNFSEVRPSKMKRESQVVLADVAAAIKGEGARQGRPVHHWLIK